MYFVNTRLFTGNKWGTANPVMTRDADFGVIRVRAYGTYDFRVVDPKLFLREVAGSDRDLRLDEFAETMRSRLVSVFSGALASARIPALDLATRYREVGEAPLPLVNPAVAPRYGVEITAFVLENASVPPEVEAALDTRAGMTAVGDLNDCVKIPDGPGHGAGRRGGPPARRRSSRWASPSRSR